MARVKLAEHSAKKLLADDYHGTALHLDTLADDIKRLDDKLSYIIKVDQGVKKRGKQGLIRLNITRKSAKKAVRELASAGFERFIAEPMLTHDDADERYISFERTRNGVVILYSEHGGITIEDSPESVKQFTPDDAPLDKDFVARIVNTMDREHLSFVEINPLVIQAGQYHLLDAAVLADSAGQFASSWNDDDIVDMREKNTAELSIEELNNNSPAAFSFRMLNPDGAIWLLLSGGGASITIADEAANLGKADLIGNYGEYSGGPSAEETYLYTKHVLAMAIASKAPRKALVIAGGVANFTDVAKTFKGLIQAFDESKSALQKSAAKVYVRRGGPNETEGLAMMEKFLKANNLFGNIHGSETTLTDVIHEALEDIDA